MKTFVRRACLKILKTIDRKQYVAVGSHDRHCPMCGHIGVFYPFGMYNIRPDVICARCGSRDRHRLLKLWHLKNPGVFAGGRILHFAPEPKVAELFREVAAEYVTADLFRNDVDFNWNIESIESEDASFDGIICNHVLEHVDAPKALSEMRRILRPGGAAIVMVPLYEGLDRTYRNPEAAAGSDRARWVHFHQEDHIQLFGRDFRDLLHNAGFEVEEYVAEGEAAARHGLVVGERVFVLR